jgi:hypothetical protein
MASKRKKEARKKNEQDTKSKTTAGKSKSKSKTTAGKSKTVRKKTTVTKKKITAKKAAKLPRERSVSKNTK